MSPRRIITIPSDLIRFSAVDWDIEWRGQSASVDNGGATQIVYNLMPRWRGTAEMVLPSRLLAQWRGIRAAAQGRAAVFRVPLIDPIAFDLEANTPDQVRRIGVPFSTGQRFSTGYGMAYDPMVTAFTTASAGSEVVQISCGQQPVPVVGQIMSADDWPFVVTSVSEVTEGVHELGVQMPLRKEIQSGDPIAVRGWGLFELATDMAASPKYGLSRIGRPSLELIEWLR